MSDVKVSSTVATEEGKTLLNISDIRRRSLSQVPLNIADVLFLIVRELLVLDDFASATAPLSEWNA